MSKKHLKRDCEVVFHIIDRLTSEKTASEFLRRINAHCLRRIHELAQQRLNREAKDAK